MSGERGQQGEVPLVALGGGASICGGRAAGQQGKEKKVAEYEQSAGELKLKLEQHREQFALYTQTLHWELDRFNRGKNRELISAITLYAQVRR